MPIKLYACLLLLFVAFGVHANQAVPASTGNNKNQSPSEIELLKNKVTALEKSLQEERTKNAEMIKTLKAQQAQQTAHLGLNAEMGALKEKVSGVEADHGHIYTFISILMGILAVLTGGGAFYSIREARLYKAKWNEIVDEFMRERTTLMADLDTNSRSLMQQFDQSERIMRLSQMLYAGDYNDDIFYADLTQLAQHPTAQMLNLVNSMLSDHSDKFEADILALAEQIRDGA